MEKYPPSEPCTGELCRSYCNRSGRRTVEQAQVESWVRICGLQTRSSQSHG